MRPRRKGPLASVVLAPLSLFELSVSGEHLLGLGFRDFNQVGKKLQAIRICLCLQPAKLEGDHFRRDLPSFRVLHSALPRASRARHASRRQAAPTIKAWISASLLWVGPCPTKA
jgi:hypothetical protein